ncbi:MAG TPA: hypothetical protein PKC53_04255 [Azohydromonas sp.]|nr:hypothetical protein [Azohydromonas sp.]
MNLLPLSFPAQPEANAAFVADAALFANGVITLEELATLHGLDSEAARARLEHPDTAAEVEARAVMMRGDGTLARAKAHEALICVIDRLHEHAQRPDLPAGTCVRVADVLSRIAGVVSARTEAPTRSTFSVNIVLSGTAPAVVIEEVSGA